MKLKFNTDICTECHSCELSCSMAHYDVYNTQKASLRIITKFPDSPDLAYCRHCSDALCVMACKFDALLVENQVIILDTEKCVNCGMCQDACPYDAIFKLPDDTYFKCDYCKGEFKCTKTCATGALSIAKEGE
ncbi:4Fe-4S dicluster domain-containing protein [Alkaliphilus peptidifermentans]|uniref:Carbon-monoxide dehydrogenase iron sulfur subunit n=1 Tax=Alkaliphilus peptidifermentans DSM 18978 TaxID=1120976 RepID=A0A1G5CTP7_9FIRM|nr:4Fe-4S dicluster domain-containing protein [Alkaliphilus peptidifermentans]SCY05833.1 carbon-monoxide dehydrogenase iron sulfur subunit [Alkaliphilus peptidifermentans DSM 18978]